MSESDTAAWIRNRLTDGVTIARSYFPPGDIDDSGVIVRITRIPADEWTTTGEPDLAVQERITAMRQEDAAC